ncbi:TetR/AcrR family transcriptional regulator [Nonomuraea insulae]|uniref:TetR/AcrR family transcriptional regulator n=1 Tax=Nonomuraea insulae TaxID=1616787 RepID=A0ABW1CBG8_9ACTN
MEDAILRAAIDEVAERGYALLTMAQVAQRAGTNKNAIYRRWPTRAALALAAYRRFVGPPADPPDTGDLRSDVLALLREVVGRMNSPVNGEMLRGAMTEIHQRPETTDELRKALANEPSAMMAILARAISRGEARASALTPRMAGVPLILLRHEYQIAGGAVDIPDKTIVEIVDDVFLPMVRP